MFRHRATGALLPLLVQPRMAAAIMRGEPSNSLSPENAAHLRACFTYEGTLPDPVFQDGLRRILTKALPDTRIFILLANTHGQTEMQNALRHQNTIIADAAAEFPNTVLLAPSSFMTQAELDALKTPQHYERMVYHRMFQHMMSKLPEPAGA
jgi:hypothetical protein